MHLALQLSNLLFAEASSKVVSVEKCLSTSPFLEKGNRNKRQRTENQCDELKITFKLFSVCKEEVWRELSKDHLVPYSMLFKLPLTKILIKVT